MFSLFRKPVAPTKLAGEADEKSSVRRASKSPNEILTDIFEISSDSKDLLPVASSDAFKEMREVINLLLHPKEKRSVNDFETDLQRVDIEINNETLRSIKAALHSEESEEQLQKKFEDAKQAFISFPGDAILAELKMKKIVELKQSVLHAALPFLARHYRLDHQSYNYYLGTKQTKTKMTRNTLENKDVFTIVFAGPCYWLIDGVEVVNNTYSNVKEGISVQDVFLTLNEDGHLQRYPNPIEGDSRTEIFHLTVIGELDLSLFTLENQSVTARFRVEVSSTCKQFRYFGPRQSESITLMQLKNLSDIERIGHYDFSRAPIVGKKINQFLVDRTTELQRAIETIISQKEKIEARKGDLGTIFTIQRIRRAQSTLLTAVLKLFSAAMNKKIMQNIVDAFADELLKEHINLLIDETNCANQRGVNLSKKFQEKFTSYLNKKKDFGSLVEQTLEELAAVFEGLTDGKLLELYLMMNINFVNELKVGALYFERHTERFMLDGKELDDPLQSHVARYSSGVSQEITAIVLALMRNLEKRGYKIIYPGTRITPNVSKQEEETIEPTKAFEEDLIRYIEEKQSKNHFGPKYENIDPFYYELAHFDCDLEKALSSLEYEGSGAMGEEVLVKAGKKVKKTLQELTITVPSPSEELQASLLGSVPIRERGEFRNIFNNSSTMAILLERGILKGFNEGLSLHYLVDLALSGWPEDRLAVQPYLLALDVSGGIIGTFIGRHAILYPNKPLNKWIVAWETCTRGTSLIVLAMFGSIVIYRNYFNNSTNCPSRTECGMEPIQFLTNIVLPSALFGIANTVSRLRYDLQYLNHGEVKRLSYRIPNWLSTSIYNTLLIQTFFLKDILDRGSSEETTIFIPSIAIGFSLATGLEVLPWRKVWEFIPALMALLSVATYLGIWYQESEEQRQQDTDPLTAMEGIRIAFWSLLTAFQFLFIFRNSTQFIGNYVGDLIQIMKMEPKQKLLQNLDNHITSQGYGALDEESTISNSFSDQKSYDEIETNSSLDLSAIQRPDLPDTPADPLDEDDEKSVSPRSLILSGTLSRSITSTPFTSTSSTLTKRNSKSNPTAHRDEKNVFPRPLILSDNLSSSIISTAIPSNLTEENSEDNPRVSQSKKP